jgi:hypothetical protein
LPAVLAAASHPAVGHVASTPSARLRADATSHGADFSRGTRRIPVSLTVGSRYAPELCRPPQRCSIR